MTASKRILVLGAGGLIGSYVANDLTRRGLSVIAAARRFTPAQRADFAIAREIPITRLDTPALTRLLQEADVVVNCLGVLQDNPADSTQNVHLAFVDRLIGAIRTVERPILLVHLSIPGAEVDDKTEFSRSKRSAEHRIVEAGLPYAILRPGFVFAPRAYGGSALLRALAALPFTLPPSMAGRPLSVVAVEAIADTVAVLAPGWQQPDPKYAAIWELMHPEPTSFARWPQACEPGSAMHGVCTSRCRCSCRHSAPKSAISRLGSAGVRRSVPPRSPNCSAASLATHAHGWRRPASRRVRSMTCCARAPSQCRTNGSRGFICSRR
jgi:uncharacterized protein YbjT (DUF2867 family)